MFYTPYTIYSTFKMVENDVKKKDVKIQDEETFNDRVTEKNLEVCQGIADLFNTKFSNLSLEEYIRCGFHHFKTFGYDKFYREIVLNEYMARDARKKRNPNDDLSSVMGGLKHIGKNINLYLAEDVDGQKRIVYDYIRNNITSTIVVYCIWRNLYHPSDVDWEYMTQIKNNYLEFEKNVVKFAPMIDKWVVKMKKVK